MDALLGTTVLLAFTIALSLLLERFLEILKASYDLLDSKLDWYHYWTRRAYKMRDRLEKKLKVFEYVDPKFVAVILYQARKMLVNGSQGYPGEVPILAGDLVRAAGVKVAFKFLSLVLGVVLAFGFQIDLVGVWNEAAGAASKWVLDIDSKFVRLLMSGLIVGLGTSPVHKAITVIEWKRKEREEGKIA